VVVGFNAVFKLGEFLGKLLVGGENFEVAPNLVEKVEAVSPA